MMAGQAEFHWPHGETGAVSLSFDDGMRSHIHHVIPELEKAGFRGTFYINPSNEMWEKHKDDWRKAHAGGHEIGNHTMSHPCDLNNVGPAGLCSWTLERIEADIVEADRVLNETLPDPRPRSFAYPCYETDVGHGLNRKSYVPIVAKHLPCARAAGRSKQRTNHPLYSDLHYLSCRAVEDMDSQQLTGAADLAISEGGWLILTFHGIEEGHLPVALVHFRRLLNYLVREKGRIWVAPVVEVGGYLGEFRMMNDEC